MRRYVLIIIIICLLIAGVIFGSKPEEAPQQAASQSVDYKKVEIRSDQVDDIFSIDIVLPDGYDLNPEKKYPVLYMTDGNGREPDYETIHSLISTGSVKDVIVVGIGYPEDHDVIESREREFNQNPDDFLDFILSDIIPYIDQNYKTDISDRTLYGSSLGGYFSLYAFIKCETGQAEDVFKNYVAVSWCCMTKEQEKRLYDAELKLKAFNRDFITSLCVTVGDWDTQSLLDNFNKIIDVLESRKYPGLDFTHVLNEGRDHSTNGAPSLLEALEKYLAEP